ncbi:MAG: RNA methyltransferase [Candidatus Krumholzibacteriia bacterium]
MAFGHVGDELEKELALSDGGIGNGEGGGVGVGSGPGSGKGRGRRRGGGGGKGAGGGQQANGRGGGRNAGRKRKPAGEPRPDKLTSPANPQVKALVRLRHRRARDQEGLTIIEEPLVLRRAWEAGYPLQTVYYCRDMMTDPAKELLEDLRAAVAVGQTAVTMVELASNLLRKAAYRDTPEGILAVAPQQRKTLDDLVLGAQPFLMVLENVEKPGNLGAVLRIADGVGADAVLVTGEGTDLYNPNVLRASRGAFFSVPAVHCQIGEARDFLHDRGVKVLASTPKADTVYDRADLTGPLAVVLGCEHDGLSEAWLKDEGCVAVRIPMRGRSDSLNVSTAAAVLMYEALRQRTAG